MSSFEQGTHGGSQYEEYYEMVTIVVDSWWVND